MPQKFLGLIILFFTFFILKSNPSDLSYLANLDTLNCPALTGVGG